LDLTDLAPTKKTEASAAIPAVAWTTIPPAKSLTPHLNRKPIIYVRISIIRRGSRNVQIVLEISISTL
jgi:hypothetical protein